MLKTIQNYYKIFPKAEIQGLINVLLFIYLFIYLFVILKKILMNVSFPKRNFHKFLWYIIFLIYFY